MLKHELNLITYIYIVMFLCFYYHHIEYYINIIMQQHYNMYHYHYHYLQVFRKHWDFHSTQTNPSRHMVLTLPTTPRRPTSTTWSASSSQRPSSLLYIMETGQSSERHSRSVWEQTKVSRWMILPVKEKTEYDCFSIESILPFLLRISWITL